MIQSPFVRAVGKAVHPQPLTTQAHVSSPKPVQVGNVMYIVALGRGFFWVLYLLSLLFHQSATLICSSVTDTIEVHEPKSYICM
jgi:hypothetical protein